MSFSIFDLIDAGNFGEILLSRKLGGVDDNKVYAIKTIVDEDTQHHHRICYNELKMLKLVCQEPFFVQLKYAFKTPRIYAFVMEYYPLGNLFKYIENHRTLTIAEAKICAAEIVLAISYLHERRIVYRDLKLENILISHDFHILLTDFGLAKTMPRSGKIADEAGTATYFAPEMISGNGYSFEVDWWSLGILMHEMLVGHSPFIESELNQSQRRMIHLNLNTEPNFTKLQSLQGFSRILEEFLSQLLIKNPEDRLGATQKGYYEVKSHQFFTTLNWAAVKLKKYKCLEEFSDGFTVRIDRSNMPEIKFPDPSENESKKFYFVAPELKNEKKSFLGPTQNEIGDAPQRIRFPDPNRSIDLLLKPNMFLRTDVETAKRALKQLMSPIKSRRPQAVNKPVGKDRTEHLTDHHTENNNENRPGPYLLRRRRVSERRSTIAI